MDFELNNDYLAHHGIKGQKWGIRRYQNEDGSLTQLGRQRRGISDKSVREKIKDKVNQAKEKKAAKAKESEAEKHESLKEHVRKHPSRLYKYRTEFSDDEIRDLTNKIRTDTALKDIRDAEIQRGWNKMQQFSQNLGKIKGLAENAKGMYNLMAEVNNVLVDSGKVNGKRMLKIGEKPEEKKVDKAALLRNMSVDDILKNQKAFTANELAEYVKWSNSVDVLNKKAASSIPEVKSTEDLVQDIVDNLPKNTNWYSGRDPDWYVSHGALGTNVEDISDEDFLAHHGILGMKWGVRRYQNADGTLTEEGKARYLKDDGEFDKSKVKTKTDKKIADAYNKNYYKQLSKQAYEEYDSLTSMPRSTEEERKKKADAERKYIESAMSENSSALDNERAAALMSKYAEKSGNWYDGTSVTEAHAKAAKNRNAALDEFNKVEREVVEKYNYDYMKDTKDYIKSQREKRRNDPAYKAALKKSNDADNELTKVALKDIGFEDNPEIYDLAQYIWRWD